MTFKLITSRHCLPISRSHGLRYFLTIVALFSSLVSGWAVPLDLNPPAIQLPSTKRPIPPKLADALKAIKSGEPKRAMDLARNFLKDEPSSILGHEVLAAAALSIRDWKVAETALSGALKLDSKRVGDKTLLGYVYLEMGQPRKAEAQFREILAVSASAEVRQHLADALHRDGRSAEALAELQKIRGSGKSINSDSLYLSARIYHETGRLNDAERTLDEVLKAKPDLLQAALLQGLVKLDLRKLVQSERLLKLVAERDKNSPLGKLGWAALMRLQGRIGEAQSALQGLAKEQPDWPDVHYELAQTLLVQDNIEGAKKSFDRVEQTSKDKAVARVRIGQALLAAGDIDGALHAARASLRTPSAGASARALLVQALRTSDRLAAAEVDLKSAVAASPNDPAALIDLGQFYLTVQRHRDAIAQFEKVDRISRDSPAAVKGLALAYAAIGDRSQAIAIADRYAKTQKQDRLEAQAFTGSVYERLGQPKEAENIYLKVLQSDGTHLAAGTALATLYAREKRFAEAIRLLGDLSKAHPQTTVPLVDLAEIYVRSGQKTQAIATYKQSLAQGGEDAVSLNNLAFLLSSEPGMHGQALDYAERAHRVARGAPWVADTLGWLLAQKGDLSRAEKLLRGALKTEPSNPEYKYHLGAILAKQGKREEARREIEQALKNPRFTNTKEAKQLVNSL